MNDWNRNKKNVRNKWRKDKKRQNKIQKRTEFNLLFLPERNIFTPVTCLRHADSHTAFYKTNSSWQKAVGRSMKK